jgi:hypothetical protein
MTQGNLVFQFKSSHRNWPRKLHKFYKIRNNPVTHFWHKFGIRLNWIPGLAYIVLLLFLFQATLENTMCNQSLVSQYLPWQPMRLQQRRSKILATQNCYVALFLYLCRNSNHLVNFHRSRFFHETKNELLKTKQLRGNRGRYKCVVTYRMHSCSKTKKNSI